MIDRVESRQKIGNLPLTANQHVIGTLDLSLPPADDLFLSATYT